ncbi:hypothetical protein, partial [Kribbella sancticallisti]|uniref:hypothetical protein n=1 Tax=Kribbella sancticallisti TaxID=460087 RepID=UPI0031CFB586
MSPTVDRGSVAGREELEDPVDRPSEEVVGQDRSVGAAGWEPRLAGWGTVAASPVRRMVERGSVAERE